MSVSTITVAYCSADDVARQLQVREFGGEGATSPSLEDVENSILEAQDEIDQQTHHAWREKTISNEKHDLNQLRYEPDAGWPIYLKHRAIKTLSSSDGDKIEMWDGSAWVDWVASSDYTEGRGNDYWMDYEQGVLYIRSATIFAVKNKAVRITYRHGTSTVPKDIRKACLLMACIDVLESNNRTLLVPEESNPMLSYASKISRWNEKIERTLSNHAEIMIPYGA